MIEVRVNIDVEKPMAAVFAFLSDWSNNPSWQTGMKACTWTSEPPLQLGSTYDQEARFLGRTIVSSFEVIEFEPGAKVRIKSTKSSLPLDITRQVTATGESSCIVSAVVRGEPSGLMRLVNPLMRRVVSNSIKADYVRLKAHLET
jgi:uncharacterized membrane protein